MFNFFKKKEQPKRKKPRKLKPYQFNVGIYTVTVKADTAKKWQKFNPVLRDGEPGYDKTNKVMKRGDGKKKWLDLEILYKVKK